jgi:hypothetical protein
MTAPPAQPPFGPTRAPDNDRLSSFALLNEACAIAAAADAYSTLGEFDASDLTITFLLGRALELALKAALLQHGATERQLRDLGHKLTDALAAAESHGYSLQGTTTQQDRAAIELLILA